MKARLYRNTKHIDNVTSGINLSKKKKIQIDNEIKNNNIINLNLVYYWEKTICYISIKIKVVYQIEWRRKK